MRRVRAAAPPATEKIVPTEVGEMSPEEAGGHGAGGVRRWCTRRPHGGTTVKIGTAAQLEFVLDPSSGMLTAYVLDGDGHEPPSAPRPRRSSCRSRPPGGRPTALSLASTANGLTGDTVGNSSQFGGTLPALKGATAFTGVVKSFTAGGQTVSNVAFSYPQIVEALRALRRRRHNLRPPALRLSRR